MRFLNSLSTGLLLLAAGAAQAASLWSFDDATVALNTKKGAGTKEKYVCPGVMVELFSAKAPLAQSLALSTADSLKVILTAKDGSKGARPHQAFVLLQDPASGLEAPFPMTVKDNGKAVVEIKHADLPLPLLTTEAPLQASIILASFGSSAPLKTDAFTVSVKSDPGAAPVVYEAPLRYGKRDEIHHVFRGDPQSPPKIISAVFVLAVLATVPALFVGWLAQGANLSHLSKALSAAPLAHGVFFGSLLALEGVFYLYYLSWSLFKVLPVAGLLGAATFLSGAKALGEVQGRRLAGER
ncbi:Oligosaccharyltransferase subunit Ribophorin II-domain-containing protein [Xylariaceae sp. FL0016]|nr:Oligosaccharyltransferase subunit Ribophorin II-domain-containing protein [Xylariaceae sp. FL0016]